MKYTAFTLLLMLGISCNQESINTYEIPGPSIEGTWIAYRPESALYDSLEFDDVTVRMWIEDISEISLYTRDEHRLDIGLVPGTVPYQWQDDGSWLLIDFDDSRGWEAYKRKK